MIQVCEYNPAWKLQFEILKKCIWPLISSGADRIEHVGSTSVEGLWAKPVIDIDIVIKQPSSLTNVIEGLSKLGYVHRGNLGIEGREAFKCAKPDLKHHLYVCLESCLALRNHMTLREHLKNNPKDRAKYSEIKRDLAAKFAGDIDSYVDGKTDFILSILKQYEMAKDEIAAVASANKKAEVRFAARTTESLAIIISFYKSVGYSVDFEDTGKFFFAYEGEKIVATVRIVQEQGEYVLRGMYLDADSRRKGIGTKMLMFVAEYLNDLESNCYCAPYSHLEAFYGTIGFTKLDDIKAPAFLLDRKLGYLTKGSHVTLMVRRV